MGCRPIYAILTSSQSTRLANLGALDVAVHVIRALREPDAERPDDVLEAQSELECLAIHLPQALHRGTGLRRSEEHTSELQSQSKLVCRLLLVKKMVQPNRLQNLKYGSLFAQ